MKITFLRENQLERPLLHPTDIKIWLNLGFEISVQKGFGQDCFTDEDYAAQGVNLFESLPKQQDIIFKLHIDSESLDNIEEKTTVIGLCQPFFQAELLEVAAKKNITLMSLELIPRSTLAQSMDVLSSQANLAGYQAVIEASYHQKKLLPLMMTPAGTLSACKVLVLGAGVAGLQAIATAKRLGGQVEAFDPRPEAQEQIKSLGAKALDFKVQAEQTKDGYAKTLSQNQLEEQKNRLTHQLKQQDIIITTAQVFGKKAPTLITKNMLDNIETPCILVDLASETGGNIEGLETGKTITYKHLTIIGTKHLAKHIPLSACQMLSKNILSLIKEITLATDLSFNEESSIYQAIILTKNNRIVHPLFIKEPSV